LTSVPEHLEWYALPPATVREILAQLVDAEVAHLASFDVHGAEASLPFYAIWRFYHD
jgi:hypothetical protein